MVHLGSAWLPLVQSCMVDIGILCPSRIRPPFRGPKMELGGPVSVAPFFPVFPSGNSSSP